MTTKQIKFLSALLQCSTITEAVKDAGISRKTAYTWLKDDAFKKELQKAKGQILEQVAIQVSSNMASAMQTLIDIYNNEESSPQVRVNAVDCFLKNARPIMEQVNILERLEALEGTDCE